MGMQAPDSAVEVVRTLLLTDVVDSTALTNTWGDEAMAAVWSAHDRMARELMRAWRGREFDRTDGFLLLFEAVSDAVGFALDYHRGLAALPRALQARAGIHVGPIWLQANPPEDVALGAKPLEIEGLAKPVAARIMAVAQGRQTLLSEQARKALGDTPLKLRSHGHWRLKGAAEPVELFEVGDEGTPFLPPPDGEKAYRVVRGHDDWLPARDIRHGIPGESNAFVGRAEALEGVWERIEAGARLVSIIGIGGSGKTRLAKQFARRWLGEFPGGAWFCDLTASHDLNSLVQAVANGLDIPLGKEDPVVQLGHAIAGRGRCLVVLDNFEQIARHADETVAHWLDRASEACFVVTTREVLGIPGEEAYALAPLNATDALSLFLQRGRAALSHFAPDPQDLELIAELTELLDRLPLAIELAAARLRVMSPRTLLSHMSDRFRLLASTGGRRDRQATLRATFDWSWGLLPEMQKAAIAQLSVFEGGFNLESAQAVLDLSIYPEAPWTVDVLQSLVDKSFVRVVEHARFAMLSTLQEYAGEQLRTPGRFAGSGPDAVLAAQERHGRHFAQLAEVDAISSHCADLHNLMCACRRAVDRNDPEVAAEALRKTWEALKLRGPFREGIRLAQKVGAMAALSPIGRAWVECVAGVACHRVGGTADARSHLHAAHLLAQEAGDQLCEGLVLLRLCEVEHRDGRIAEAGRLNDRAMELALASGDHRLQAYVHNNRASLLLETGKVEAACVEYERGLGIARQVGDCRPESGILGNLANAYASMGRTAEARRNYEAGIAIARAIGDHQYEANMVCNLGYLRLMGSELDAALLDFQEALRLAKHLGHQELECLALGNLAIAMDALGRTAEARPTFEATLDLARRGGFKRFEGQFLYYLGSLQARQGEIDQARNSFAASQTLLVQFEDKLSIGLLTCFRAEAEALANGLSAAQALLEEAQDIARELDVGSESELGQALRRVEALVLLARRA